MTVEPTTDPPRSHVPDGPVEELTLALRHLHRRAGEPSARVISKTVDYSNVTVHNVLYGRATCRWPTLEAIVRHLNGNVEQFRLLWLAARQAEDPLLPEPESFVQYVEVHNDNPSLAKALSVEVARYLAPQRPIVNAFRTEQHCEHLYPVWAVVVSGPDHRLAYVPGLSGPHLPSRADVPE